MKPLMFCTKSSGMPRRSQSSMKCAPLSDDSLNRIPLLARIPTGWPSMCANAQTSVVAVERLELVQLGPVDDAAQQVADVVGRPEVERHEVEQAVGVLQRRARRRAAPTAAAAGAGSVATIDRTISSAWSSSSARWSTTPEVRAWTSPPPSSSAVTSSPVAAFTSGGPPRKIVPCSRTITVSSLIAGTYAPPAVHEPMTHAICGIERATSSPG